MKKNKIFVACDSTNISIIKKIIKNTSHTKLKFGYKFGLEFLNSKNGRNFVSKLKKKIIFADLKLHDIPNTVHETILGFHDCNIEMLTVHLSGGEEMLKKALLAARTIRTKVIGVSILTSLNESDSLAIFNNNLNDQIVNLFKLAKKTNIDGIVCSPHEVEIANTVLDSQSIKITPGIRDILVKDDQTRTMSAKDAIARGSSFLVIGRPITQAKDISLALKKFNDSIYG